jgi:radical SAM superfamily enzyme YgiQ (UPF0313 family)
MSAGESNIVLVTINARYIHASLGLRYLLANMGELKKDTQIQEFTLGVNTEDAVEKILANTPRIVAFGVYIWNTRQTTDVVRMLKLVAPEITVVLGGPEVSYEQDEQPLVGLADFVISGWGDVAFPRLCRQLCSGKPPSSRLIEGVQPPLDDIALPYRHYTEEDIAHRVIYVEASRGCPFKCEFCLSALDKTAWPFDADLFLAEMDSLYQRGARHFKFVDRTFNLKLDNSVRILQFFLERMDNNLFVHFELIPDRLPERLRKMIARFPAGSLQFEIGIQSFNPRVQELISRRQDNERSAENIEWIRQHSEAHIHTDLIFGLPGEDLESFAAGFNRLLALNPHEIQVGILKRLRGSLITRHTGSYGLRFNPDSPYNILSTDRIDFRTMQRISRFARYWNLLGNSGRFGATMPLLLGSRPFERFLRLSDTLYANCGRTHHISLLSLFELVHAAASQLDEFDADAVEETLSRDFTSSGLKSLPGFMGKPGRHSRDKSPVQRKNTRQVRHLTGSGNKQ